MSGWGKEWCLLGVASAHPVDLDQNHQIVILQIHRVCVSDQSGHLFDDLISRHRSVIADRGANGKLSQ